MKIALLSSGFCNWGGGVDFVHHIASAIAASRSSRGCCNILILPRQNFAFRIKKMLYPVYVVSRQFFLRKNSAYVRRSYYLDMDLNEIFSDVDSNFHVVRGGIACRDQVKCAIRVDADVVLPCFEPLDRNLSVPWVGYLSDFQHHYLPEFFSTDEILVRNQNFASMIDAARHIVVNSRSVAQDVCAFRPNSAACIHVLPFSPCPQKLWLHTSLDVRAKYGIDKPYFIISNQFWAHKDHGTAFRAFSRFLHRCKSAMLVCTGCTDDYRFPHYFADVIKLIDDLDISSSVKILGHIPKTEQIALLRHSVAVIQPTLFEGGPGGGASYDAIAMGVPVIASNIPVNLEIDCGDITYFQAGDDVALADALDTYRHRLGANAFVDNAFLWHSGMERLRKCGDFIINIAARAAHDYH